MLLSLFSFYLENSLFILTEGASKERAFQIGQEIVDEVTAANPKPVKLKFEKVFFFYLFIFCVICICTRHNYFYLYLSEFQS